MKIIKMLGIVSLGLMLSGFNFSVVKSASSADDAKAKQFTPDSTRALIYVFRDNSFLGQNLASQLVVNNVIAAKTERNRFNIVSLVPGDYELLSVSAKEANAAVSLIHNKKKEPVKLTAEAGKIYFVQEVFHPTTGFTVKVVSQEEAAPLIKKGKLIAINQL